MAVQQASFKYMGSKWRLAPWIISHMAPHKMYVEVFAGSAAVLLQKRPVSCEVYNDLDKDVYNFFRVLRDRKLAALLRRRLNLTPFSRDEFYDCYIQTADPVEKARKFLVRSCMGAGAIAPVVSYRTGFWTMRGTDNLNGFPPSAMYRKKIAQLQDITERFQNVTVENRDAEEILKIYDTPATMFYLDPPYVRETRMGKNKLYSHDLKHDDHIRLAEALHRIKGMAIISGYDCDLYRDIYSDWEMDSNTNNDYMNNKRQECLWIKPGSGAQERWF